MSQELVQLVPGQSDATYAADMKQRMAEAFKPFLLLCDEAKEHGFEVQWQVGKDYAGRIILSNLTLMKHY